MSVLEIQCHLPRFKSAVSRGVRTTQRSTVTAQPMRARSRTVATLSQEISTPVTDASSGCAAHISPSTPCVSAARRSQHRYLTTSYLTVVSPIFSGIKPTGRGYAFTATASRPTAKRSTATCACDAITPANIRAAVRPHPEQIGQHERSAAAHEAAALGRDVAPGPSTRDRATVSPSAVSAGHCLSELRREPARLGDTSGGRASKIFGKKNSVHLPTARALRSAERRRSALDATPSSATATASPNKFPARLPSLRVGMSRRCSSHRRDATTRGGCKTYTLAAKRPEVLIFARSILTSRDGL